MTSQGFVISDNTELPDRLHLWYVFYRNSTRRRLPLVLRTFKQNAGKYG